jgi:hypothetical protein
MEEIVFMTPAPGAEFAPIDPSEFLMRQPEKSEIDSNALFDDFKESNDMKLYDLSSRVDAFNDKLDHVLALMGQAELDRIADAKKDALSKEPMPLPKKSDSYPLDDDDDVDDLSGDDKSDLVTVRESPCQLS